MDAYNTAGSNYLPTAFSSLTPQFGHGTDSNSSGCSLDSMSGGDAGVAGPRKQMPRQKINARERCRTFNVNAAYEALRILIPTEPVNRKLSKIEVIRLASSYITHLRSTLIMGTDKSPCLLQHSGKCKSEYGLARVSICTFCMKQK
ncbi:transcription factor 15 [Scaptodrosophila lebanonensis]|uniref:Transcription factor 15 n=1 Tax=Drosophila lebanonensis TaxID=7225 RepID=A0A6J2TX40_DROLE|nr:transcription factor 15 [Scaptodrosophila lebanonensis]